MSGGRCHTKSSPGPQRCQTQPQCSGPTTEIHFKPQFTDPRGEKCPLAPFPIDFFTRNHWWPGVPGLETLIRESIKWESAA